MKTALTQFIARLMFLPILMISLAVWLKGYQSTGDGFSAGVMAASAVLLQLIAFGYHSVRKLLFLDYAPALAALGLLIAIMVTFGGIFFGDPIATHYPKPGQAVMTFGVVELHTALLFDFGIFLLVYGFTVSIMVLFERSRRRQQP